MCVGFSNLESPGVQWKWGTDHKYSKDPDHKNEESTGNKVHRARYLRQRAVQWDHLHSGGEVTHRPTLRRMETRKRTTHRKG
jgi:hypothetical protein